MASFLKHEPCPKCGSRDNLARYDDGSAWCFGCHYREGKDGSSGTIHSAGITQEKSILVAEDLCNDFPSHVVEWLAKYDISVIEAIQHGWKYSPFYDQLVFQWYDEDGEVLLSQARNFNPERAKKRKYYNQGSPAEVLPIFSPPEMVRENERAGLAGRCQTPKRLVVVEDAVSAARIGRQSDAMPCLGSYLPAKKIMRLWTLGYRELVVWLDADKLKEAREIETMAKWIGLSAKTLYTELDPKEYSDAEIADKLRG